MSGSTYQWLTGDFNGDGLTDLVRRKSDGSTNKVLLSGTLNGAFAFIGVDTQEGYKGVSGDTYQWLTGDFNGDGLTDLARRKVDGSTNAVLLSGTLNGAFAFIGVDTQEGYKGVSGDTYQWLTGDFNGDGLTDLARRKSDGSTNKVLLSGTLNGAFAFIGTDTQETYQGVSGDTYQWLTGDFNGDGLTDLARRKSDGSTNKVLLSGTLNGAFAFIGTDTQETYQGASGGTYEWLTGDFNGDGLTDLARRSLHGTSNVILLASLTNGAFRFSGTNTQENNEGVSGFLYDWIPGDFNGDGLTDLVRRSNDGNSNLLLFVDGQVDSPVDKLVRISLPTGGTIEASYKPATQISGAIDPTQSSYPTVAYSSPDSLVVKVKSSDGLLGTPTIGIAYGYTNHRFLSGFKKDRIDLGFQKLLNTNEITGTKTSTTFSQVFPTQGLVLGTLISDQANLPYDESLTEYPPYPVLPKVQFIAPKSAVWKKFDGSSTPTTTKRTFDSYDTYGNLTQITDLGIVDGTGIDIDALDNVRQVFQYALASSKYLSRVVSTQTFSYDFGGVEGLVSEAKYYYDGSSLWGAITNGLATAVETRVSLSPSVTATTQLVRDAWGNVIKNIDASGVTTSEAAYDADYHSLVISTTDNVGGISTVGYTGLLATSVTDPQGNIAQKAYDVFGRVVKTVSPLARDSISSPTTQTAYYDTPTFSATAPTLISVPVSIMTREKTTGSNSLPEYTYFDGLGRPVQTKTLAKVDGQYVTVDRYYDASGRVYAVSNPYLTTYPTFSYLTANLATQKKTLLTYDALGRDAKTTNPEGSFSQTFYNQTLVTKIDELKHVTQTETGTNTKINRTFTGTYPNQVLYSTTTMKTGRGKTQIIDTNGNTVTTLYDLAGRKTQYSDPDMGVWTYEYFANGSLKTQTDAKSNVISFDYDAAGRVAHKWHGGAVDTTYNYGTTGYQKGLLESVSRGNDTYDYTYDQLGRTVSVAKTIGLWGTKTVTMGYNTDGLLQSRSLPDGEVVSYAYGAEGDTSNVAGTSTYVSSVTKDDFGRSWSQGLVNGTSVNSFFDPITFRTVDLVSPGILNLHYTYDATGNVLTKTDGVNSAASETYTYDDLNRLKTANGIYGSRSYSYDSLNNLLGQNGTAVNSYNGSGPHAISGDGTYGYSYDANGNMTGRLLSGISDRFYHYDSENRLTVATVGGVETDYTYDDTHQRTTMTVGTKTTVFWFGDYEETYTSGVLTETVKSYSGPGGKVAQRSSLTGLVFLYQDHLGSTSKVRDSATSTTTARYYEPYGKLAMIDDGTVRQLFTGQEWDGSADLYYYNARFYSATLGRFIQPDTVLDGLDRYAYCANNPVNFRDPTGHFFLPFITAAIGAVVGGVAGGIIAAVNHEDVWAGIGIGAGIGAIAGLTGGLVGMGATSLVTGLLGSTTAGAITTGSSFGGAAAGAILGGGLAGMNSVMQGNSFGSQDFWGDVGSWSLYGAGMGGTAGLFGAALYNDAVVNKETTQIVGSIQSLWTKPVRASSNPLYLAASETKGAYVGSGAIVYGSWLEPKYVFTNPPVFYTIDEVNSVANRLARENGGETGAFLQVTGDTNFLNAGGLNLNKIGGRVFSTGPMTNIPGSSRSVPSGFVFVSPLMFELTATW